MGFISSAVSAGVLCERVAMVLAALFYCLLLGWSVFATSTPYVHLVIMRDSSHGPQILLESVSLLAPTGGVMAGQRLPIAKSSETLSAVLDEHLNMTGFDHASNPILGEPPIELTVEGKRVTYQLVVCNNFPPANSGRTWTPLATFFTKCASPSSIWSFYPLRTKAAIRLLPNWKGRLGAYGMEVDSFKWVSKYFTVFRKNSGVTECLLSAHDNQKYALTPNYLRPLVDQVYWMVKEAEGKLDDMDVEICKIMLGDVDDPDQRPKFDGITDFEFMWFPYDKIAGNQSVHQGTLKIGTIDGFSKFLSGLAPGP